jgi:hypothetical protein
VVLRGAPLMNIELVPSAGLGVPRGGGGEGSRKVKGGGMRKNYRYC